jgi:hypothetical protein
MYDWCKCDTTVASSRHELVNKLRTAFQLYPELPQGLVCQQKTSMPECPPARLTKVSARISVVAVQPRQAYEFPPLAICKWVLGVRSMLTRMTRLDPHCDDAKDYNPNGRHHARCRNVAFFIHCGQSNTHQCFACEPTMFITHALVTLLPPSETPCFQLRLIN